MELSSIFISRFSLLEVNFKYTHVSLYCTIFQMVRSSKNDVIIKKEKIDDELLEPDNNAKRKRLKDENEDVDGITLLNELPVTTDGSTESVKKRKKVATADKILKLEQEKV